MKIKNFYFWQNTNSIHQSAFFNALAEMEAGNIYLIVTEKLSAHRTGMGWSEPSLDKRVKVIHLKKEDYDWKALLEGSNKADSLHIFSGIAAFPSVHDAFKYAIQLKCRIGVLTEPLDFRGFKGIIRNLRGYYHKLIYASHIEVLLAIGDQAETQFLDWGYARSRVLKWAYTVKTSQYAAPAETTGLASKGPFKIMFAASLILRKGYDILIDSLIQIKEQDFTADLYCLRDTELDLGKELEAKSELGLKMQLLPFLANDELRFKMNSYDLFVLPSRHDGWGAVVNESLMEGTPVLVSKYCGASTLIRHGFVGKVATELTKDALAEELINFIQQGKLTEINRLSLRKWSSDFTSGEALAAYFKEIIVYLNDPELKPNPVAPWM